MSEELQNDGFTIDAAAEDTQPAAPTETSENPKGPELATENAQTEVKSEPTEEEKEARRQAAFNKQYGEKKQAERERDAMKAELEKMQSQAPTKPQEIGNFPSEYDYDTTEEFETAKTTFVENVQNVERYNQQQTNSNYIVQQQENERARQRQEKINADILTYTENAKKNGIDAAELQSAANSVESYGITLDLTHAILADADGPLLTKYLAANPQEVTTLIGMTPYAAGAHMLNLKVKAQALKPKASSTPAPTTDIQGGGGDPNRDSPLLKGATFD